MAAIVVFDTNVLFSAAAWKGPPYACVELARTGQIQAVTCWEILTELTEKLSERLQFSESKINDTLAGLLSFHDFARIAGTISASRDPDDDVVLECAVVAQAGYIITGDKDLLVLNEFQGVIILKAADFLKQWESGAIPK